jgi:hypothetical protein
MWADPGTHPRSKKVEIAPQFSQLINAALFVLQ